MTRTQKKKLLHIFLYLVLIFTAILTLFSSLLGKFPLPLRSDKELYSYIMPFSIHTLIPVEFTVKSWIQLFTKYKFLQPVLNTVFITAATIVFGCILNSIAAFAFAMFDFKGKRFCLY